MKYMQKFFCGILLLSIYSNHALYAASAELLEPLLPRGTVQLHNLTSKLLWYAIYSKVNGKINENNVRLENWSINQQGFIFPHQKNTVTAILYKDDVEVTYIWGNSIILFLRENKESNLWQAKSDEELKIVFDAVKKQVDLDGPGVYIISEDGDMLKVEKQTV